MFQRSTIQMLMFLHVRQIDQQIKRSAGEHLIDVRIVVRDLMLLRRASRASGPLASRLSL